jgi:hypothetical protein
MRGDVPGDDPGLRFNPGHPVVGRHEQGSLLEIDDAEDDRRKSG